MKAMKVLAIFTAIVLITACFFPWVSIENKNISVSGFHSDISNFGQPGLLHLVFCSFYILFLLINKIWSVRTAFFISAINIAWAVRNFLTISACSGGMCPVKHTALYIVLASSILILVLTLFVDMKEKGKE